MPSDCLWHEMAGTVNDSHQRDHLRAGLVCLEGWCVCMCLSPSGLEEDGPAFQPQPNPLAKNNQAADRETSCLQLPLASPNPSPPTIVIPDFLSDPLKQAPQAGFQDGGAHVTCPTERPLEQKP